MTKKEFNQRVSEMCAYVKQHEYSDINGWWGELEL